VLFVALLVGLPLARAAGAGPAVETADAFYRSGALVFGGGHVVLPLLERETVDRGWLSEEAFLAGYGAAQAVPGPLFTFAAYLGAERESAPNGVAGAALALGAVFLPGMLLLVAVLPVWERLRGRDGPRAALRGASASVVGILLAALYDPVFTAGVADASDAAVVAVALLALGAWRAPPWLVVAGCAAAGAALG
jgi:chromate transporter